MGKKKNKSKSGNGKNGAVATVTGQGGYYTDKIVPALKKVFPDGTFSKTGKLVGGALAPLVSLNPYARGLGMAAGGALGSSISRLVGFGDYSVVNNTLTTVGKAIDPGTPVPSFGVMGEATRVRHREYIGDIVATGGTVFNNQSYPIQPGLATTFPWLATMAGQYQQYIFHGLVFEFVSTASEYAASVGLGAVILGTNYDSLDAAYPDKRHMENSQYCVSAKPSMSQIHTIECLPSATANKLYYTRGASIPANADLRMYDIGLFQIATQGIVAAAGTVIGELWASYDIALYKPLLGNVLGSGQKIDPHGAGSPTNPYGSSPNYSGSTYFLVVGGNTLVCQIAGSYLISHNASCTVPTTPNYGGTGAIGMTVYYTSAPLASTTNFLQQIGVTCAVGSIITIDITTWGSTAGLLSRIVPYDRLVA